MPVGSLSKTPTVYSGWRLEVSGCGKSWCQIQADKILNKNDNENKNNKRKRICKS